MLGGFFDLPIFFPPTKTFNKLENFGGRPNISFGLDSGMSKPLQPLDSPEAEEGPLVDERIPSILRGRVKTEHLLRIVHILGLYEASDALDFLDLIPRAILLLIRMGA